MRHLCIGVPLCPYARVAVLVALAGVLACLASLTPAEESPAMSSSLHLASCEIEGVERPGRCGRLTVPENPNLPGTRTINLDVVILPARRASAEPDPILYLVGGPGVEAITRRDFLARNLTLMQQDRDLILMNYRGTGQGSGLRCDLDLNARTEALVAMRPVDGLDACFAGLEADPAMYTTGAVAEDLERLRLAMGVTRVNLVGVSYGTRVAVEYLRRHPDSVRTVVLRGVVPPGRSVAELVQRGGAAILERLVRRCAGDEACSGAFPRFPEQLAQVRRSLEVDPLVVPPGDGEKDPLHVDPGVFDGIVRFALYSDRGASALPLLIDRTAEGKMKLLLRHGVQPALEAAREFSLPFTLSILCAEDNPASAGDESGATHPLAELCRHWPVEPSPLSTSAPDSGAVPVLLLSGSEDPATPPEALRELTAGLPRHLHVVTPGLGHVPGWTSCYSKLAADLIRTGSLDGLDASCTGEFQAAAFMTHGLLSTPMILAAGGAVLLAALLLTMGLLRRRRRRRWEASRSFSST